MTWDMMFLWIKVTAVYFTVSHEVYCRGLIALKRVGKTCGGTCTHSKLSDVNFNPNIQFSDRYSLIFLYTLVMGSFSGLIILHLCNISHQYLMMSLWARPPHAQCTCVWYALFIPINSHEHKTWTLVVVKPTLVTFIQKYFFHSKFIH